MKDLAPVSLEQMGDPIILVVDDESNVVRLCQRLLEKARFQVLTATSQSQALAILARRPIDLLLLDIHMPGLDGLELLRIAHNHQPELTSIIMANFGAMETAVEAFRIGAEGMILKPFAYTELVESVQHALQAKQRWRDLERLSTLRPLFQITEEFFSETNLDQLKQSVVAAVTHSLKCSMAGLYCLQSDSGVYVQVAWHGEQLPLDDLVRRLVQKLSDDMNIWINRVGFLQSENRDLLDPYPLGSLLVVPVSRKFERELLIAARRLGEPPFRGSDLEFLQMLGRQAGIAMENSRLYEELRSYINELEASRVAVNRAEKIAAAGRITASIAHELNNPLQSISNCLHLAGRKELPETQRSHYLELAQNELERLIGTVHRTLDLYRPSARDRRLVDINDLISKVVRLMKPQLQAHLIEMTCEFAQDLPLVPLVSDQGQQLLINLILNSMDAMASGGEINIKTHRTVMDDIHGVEILVKDTGPGVSASEVEQIFEPFYTTKAHGTGLGLPVSYGIVAAHGGSLNYVSQEGEGACFRIIFPEEIAHESENPGNR